MIYIAIPAVMLAIPLAFSDRTQVQPSASGMLELHPAELGGISSLLIASQFSV